MSSIGSTQNIGSTQQSFLQGYLHDVAHMSSADAAAQAAKANPFNSPAAQQAFETSQIIAEHAKQRAQTPPPKAAHHVVRLSSMRTSLKNEVQRIEMELRMRGAKNNSLDPEVRNLQRQRTALSGRIEHVDAALNKADMEIQNYQDSNLMGIARDAAAVQTGGFPPGYDGGGGADFAQVGTGQLLDRSA